MAQRHRAREEAAQGAGVQLSSTEVVENSVLRPSRSGEFLKFLMSAQKLGKPKLLIFRIFFWREV
jgi:hypothetical protein